MLHLQPTLHGAAGVAERFCMVMGPSNLCSDVERGTTRVMYRRYLRDYDKIIALPGVVLVITCLPSVLLSQVACMLHHAVGTFSLRDAWQQLQPRYQPQGAAAPAITSARRP